MFSRWWTRARQNPKGQSGSRTSHPPRTAVVLVKQNPEQQEETFSLLQLPPGKWPLGCRCLLPASVFQAPRGGGFLRGPERCPLAATLPAAPREAGTAGSGGSTPLARKSRGEVAPRLRDSIAGGTKVCRPTCLHCLYPSQPWRVAAMFLGELILPLVGEAVAEWGL